VKLFEDETDLLFFPPLRAAWGLRGQPLQVPIAGRNARRVIFGTITIATGHRLFLARKRQREEDLGAFLPMVASQYRGWPVAWLLDEDPCHTAQGSQDVAEQLGMKLIWLPKRCPELNGMDHLWGPGKDQMCASKQ
jgi:DDE superfamily endonuclease